MPSIQLARDVYGANPVEPDGRGSSLPVRATPVVSVVKSEDLYVVADHWRGMQPRYTACRCACHVYSDPIPNCGSSGESPHADYCNAPSQE